MREVWRMNAAVMAGRVAYGGIGMETKCIA